VTFDSWLIENDKELIGICKNITQSSDYIDIHQIVILSLLERRETMNTLTDKEKLYYYIGAIKMQFFSKTSKYHYLFRKNQLKHTEILNLEYIEPNVENKHFTLDFVNKELDKMSWFDRDLFLLYIELGTLNKVSEQTTIPINSVSKYIRKIKKTILQNYKKNE
jgi:hypothetical protein